MKLVKSTALAIALAMVATSANAQLPGGSQAAFTPAGFSPQGSGGAFTMGFAFTASAGTFVNGLGAYDNNSDGFPAPMTVGLWNGAGTLLLQTTVGSGDLLVNSFRYALLPSYELQAGTTYVVGAFRYAGSGETYATGFGGGTAAPGITTLDARYNDSGSFAFPNIAVGTNGYFGANALVGSQVVTQSGVPEPATWAMMIGGFGLVGGALRRRSIRPAFA